MQHLLQSVVINPWNCVQLFKFSVCLNGSAVSVKRIILSNCVSYPLDIFHL